MLTFSQRRCITQEFPAPSARSLRRSSRCRDTLPSQLSLWMKHLCSTSVLLTPGFHTPAARAARLCRASPAHLRRVRAQHTRGRPQEVPDQHGEARQAQEEEPRRAVLYDGVQDVLQEKAPVRKARKPKRESSRRCTFEVH